MPIGLVSRGEKGEVKLEYELDGGRVCKLWERMPDSILETIFDSDGGVLDQRLLQPTSNVEQLISKEASNHGLELQEARFSVVKLNKGCPSCSSDSLSRHSEAFRSKGSVPVMPTYLCKSCGARSYYLTDGYLDSLVKGNKVMFTDEELGELDTDEAAFKAELKAYIIRIFASKRIMCIK